MASFRQAGPLGKGVGNDDEPGSGPRDSSHVKRPGPIGTDGAKTYTSLGMVASSTAGLGAKLEKPPNSSQRTFSTDKRLLTNANYVQLSPPHNKTIFYHGDAGAGKASEFARKDPSFKRLDDLLHATASGTRLLHELLELHKSNWESAKGVWWELSARLAEESSGDVWVFGGGVYEKGHDLSTGNPDGRSPGDFRSRFKGPNGKRAYLDTVFDKVELPILQTNDKVDTIYYNGVATDW